MYRTFFMARISLTSLIRPSTIQVSDCTSHAEYWQSCMFPNKQITFDIPIEILVTDKSLVCNRLKMDADLLWFS